MLLNSEKYPKTLNINILKIQKHKRSLPCHIIFS